MFVDSPCHPPDACAAMAKTTGLTLEVRRLRKAANLTHEVLAAQAGVTSITISRLERGVSIPSEDTLRGIAGPLGTTFEHLRPLMEAALTGERVRLLREHHRLSVAELAQQAKVSAATVTLVEQGREVDPSARDQVANVLGYSGWSDLELTVVGDLRQSVPQSPEPSGQTATSPVTLAPHASPRGEVEAKASRGAGPMSDWQFAERLLAGVPEERRHEAFAAAVEAVTRAVRPFTRGVASGRAQRGARTAAKLAR